MQAVSCSETGAVLLSAAMALLYLRKSIELRRKAVEALRKARALPPGSERNELRQIALAYKALSESEAWLSGERNKPKG